MYIHIHTYTHHFQLLMKFLYLLFHCPPSHLEYEVSPKKGFPKMDPEMNTNPVKIFRTV